METGLAKSGVVIHSNPVTQRYRLAGQHISVRDLFIGEPVARGHFDLSLGDLGTARRAYPRLAREWRGQARGARAVEDVAGGERNAAGPAVEGDGDRNAFRLGL